MQDATDADIERMGGNCAICWGEMTVPGVAQGDGQPVGTGGENTTDSGSPTADRVVGGGSGVAAGSVLASPGTGRAQAEVAGVTGEHTSTTLDQSAGTPGDTGSAGSAGQRQVGGVQEGRRPRVADAGGFAAAEEGVAAAAEALGSVAGDGASRPSSAPSSEGFSLPCGHAYHHPCLHQWLHQCHAQVGSGVRFERSLIESEYHTFPPPDSCLLLMTS